MYKTMKPRRFMTLIEIMIVMFLITIIAGVVTYKVKDSIDYGKAFKTHQNIVQLRQILKLAAINKTAQQVENTWEKCVDKSPLAGNTSALKKDGWNEPYESVSVENKNGVIQVTIKSEKFENYKKSHDTWFDNDGSEEDSA